MRPIPLRPDNFTLPSRTPWGGTRLLGRYKAGLGLAAGSAGGTPRVGESWELSAGEELPSHGLDGRSLAEILSASPATTLGAEARLGRTTTALLVKWLDAADDLSLQIHPRDDYAGLRPDEAGKVEAWYVVEADPGAGFYMGFREGVTQAEVEQTLRSGGDLRARMRFVPARPGDLALIEPGMPHAVGRGLMLIEPQRVRPGRRAVTYRYWDFDRRYDALGQPDPAGTARALHLEQALAVTAWEHTRDAAWLGRRTASAGPARTDAAPQLEPLAGPEAQATLRSDALRIDRLHGHGTARLAPADALRALTVVAGRVALGPRGDEVVLPAGMTAALPAALPACEARLEHAHALLCSVLG